MTQITSSNEKLTLGSSSYSPYGQYGKEKLAPFFQATQRKDNLRVSHIFLFSSTVALRRVESGLHTTKDVCHTTGQST